MIQLIAKRAFTHGARPYRPGERFQATPVDAASLTYRGLAAFAPTESATEPAASNPPAKGKYRRRDLQAEK